MKSSMAPVTGSLRIREMDALRGFAILGIFIANLGSGFSFYDPSGPNQGPLFSSFDHTMTFLHHMLIEGKFYSIFSFLFGWGIAIQLGRSGDKGLQPARFVRRRLLFMFLLGLAHIILLWPGDIVAFYSLVGFILLWMRNLKERTLFITAIILILSPILLYALKMKWPSIFMAPSGILWQTGQNVGTRLTGITSEQEFIEYNRHLSYFKLVRINMAGFFFRFADLFFQSRISKVLGMFLIGYLAARSGRYKNIMTNKKILLMVVIIGLVVALPANYILANYMEHDNGAYYQLKMMGWYRTVAYAFGVAPLACVYIALFFLAYNSRPGKKILALLQPVGRTAFSNYILQSIIGTFVFTGLGLGMMGKVGPTFFTLFALLVFMMQMILSRIWLRYFQFGPVEWLWRSGTYGKWQPFRKNGRAETVEG
jgi:uncharacterized protein